MSSHEDYQAEFLPDSPLAAEPGQGTSRHLREAKHTDTRNLQGVQLREMQKINSLGTVNNLTFLYDYLVYHT